MTWRPAFWGVVISMFAAPATAKVLTLLTPYVLIGDMGKSAVSPLFILAGIALQVGIYVLILLAIQRRLARPVHAPVAGAA